MRAVHWKSLVAAMARFEVAVTRRTEPERRTSHRAAARAGSVRSCRRDRRGSTAGHRRRHRCSRPWVLHRRARDRGHTGGHLLHPPPQRFPGAPQMICLLRSVRTI